MTIKEKSLIKVIDVEKGLEADFTVGELYDICVSNIASYGNGGSIDRYDVPKVAMVSWLPQIEKIRFHAVDNELVNIFRSPSKQQSAYTEIHFDNGKEVTLYLSLEKALRKSCGRKACKSL